MKTTSLSIPFSPRAFSLALALSLSCAAQTPSAQIPSAPAPNVATPAAIARPLVPYTSCVFPDMLRIVQVDPLAPDVTSRSVDTKLGPQSIDLVAGARILFAYPMTDFFANARVELLPAGRYLQLKQILIANLRYLESQPHGPMPAEALPVGLHGFDVHGNDRHRLEGDVLGMYLLFDDKAHIVTTVYFLNQQAWRRKFQSMDEYGRLRDHFLQNYTACVRQNEALEH